MMKRLMVMMVSVLAVTTAIAGDANSNTTLKVDLDAVVSTGFVQPVDGITSAGQPDEAALTVFAEQGYTTVIDLRTKGEDRGIDAATVIGELGMDYVLFPIAGKSAINFENARKLSELIEDADGPVLLHCGSGNRVGALLALKKSLDGADDASALAYGKEGGVTSLEGRVKDVLGKQ
jgi:uncharacterized protein (TIGR01244 family)